MRTTWLMLVLSLLLLFACGDDDTPSTPEVRSPCEMGTPYGQIRTLLDFFSVAYSRRDSSAYEALLDDQYMFIPVRRDTTKPPDDPYDLEEELVVAGRMFSGWMNPDSAWVKSINLSISVKTISEDTTSYLGRQGDDVWYSVLATVDLECFVIEEGFDGFTNYIVLSDQEFILRPTPQLACYLVYRQIDQPFDP